MALIYIRISEHMEILRLYQYILYTTVGYVLVFIEDDSFIHVEDSTFSTEFFTIMEILTLHNRTPLCRNQYKMYVILNFFSLHNGIPLCRIWYQLYVYSILSILFLLHTSSSYDFAS